MQIQIARYISHTAVSALIILHSDEKNCKISVKWCLFQKLVSAEIRAGRASKGLYVAVCFFGLFYSGHKAAVIQNTHCAVMTIALFFLVVHSCACGWCTGWRNQLQICTRWGRYGFFVQFFFKRPTIITYFIIFLQIFIGPRYPWSDLWVQFRAVDTLRRQGGKRRAGA